MTHQIGKIDGKYVIAIQKCDDLLKYLYDELYYEIVSINDNGNLRYHIHNGELYVVSYCGDYLDADLLREYVYNEADVDEQFLRDCQFHYRCVDKHNKYANSPKNCQLFDIRKEDKIDYELFKKLMVYLENWTTENAAHALVIRQTGNAWQLECLIQNPELMAKYLKPSNNN
jgi:hypothetical protein